jgi:hypothetical protein
MAHPPGNFKPVFGGPASGPGAWPPSPAVLYSVSFVAGVCRLRKPYTKLRNNR